MSAHADPRLESQTLESLLIQPVQRLPRYKLLLEKLLHYTDFRHNDRVVLRQAHQLMVDVCMEVNESIRQVDNQAEVLRCHNLLKES